VYAYEDVNGGFTTYIASNRIVGDVPEVPPVGSVSSQQWSQAYDKQMKYLDTAAHEPIGLPFDGEAFNDPDLESFEQRLRNLSEAGYHVPEHVFQIIAEEKAQAIEGS
jgi:hypothetical protein